MSGECHSTKPSVDSKEGKCTSQSEKKSLRILTAEGETITFPESFEYCMVKQEPQDWDEKQTVDNHRQVVVWDSDYFAEISKPVDFVPNSSQLEPQQQGSSLNIAVHPEANKDGDVMEIIEASQSVSAVFISTERRPEDTVLSALSFDGYKIKEEPEAICQKNVIPEIFSCDPSFLRDERQTNIRRNQSAEKVSLPPVLVLRNMETQTEEEEDESENENGGRNQCAVKHRPHKCNFCEKRFTERSTLRKHTLIHTGERPHECNLCKKLFRERSALQKHILTHTGEKPHKCKLCEKQFSQRSVLNRHMLIHTGEKPHKCNLCEKQFRDTGTLHRHMLSHTGEKPYACTLCTKRYMQSCHLRKHMLSHVKNSALVESSARKAKINC